MKGALRCYREALADSPDSEPAKTRAELLTAVIEKQVCPIIGLVSYGVYPLFFSLSLSYLGVFLWLSLDCQF